MGAMDNVYVQIALVVLVFYLATQYYKQPRFSEHLETSGPVGVNTVPVVLSSSAKPPAQTSTAAISSSPSANVATSGPQPLSSMAEPILAQAPPDDTAPLTVAPVDYEK